MPEIHFTFGRCRSGRRWFWVLYRNYTWNDCEFGWAETEASVKAAADAAVERLSGGCPAVTRTCHRWASEKLRKINRAKRAARPAAETADARPVEYLFAERCWTSDYDCEPRHYIRAFPIVKKTKCRIFYRRQGVSWPIEHGSVRDDYTHEDEIGFVDRQKLEADGEVRNRGRHWSQDDAFLYLKPPEKRELETPDIRQLKAEMAAAHPDRGGSSAAFITARERYVAARRMRQTKTI